MAERYATFAEFYPFYLSEHTNRICRRLHFVGTTIGLVCLLTALATGRVWYVIAGLATFTYPLYSFMGDRVMWRDILVRRIKF